MFGLGKKNIKPEAKESEQSPVQSAEKDWSSVIHVMPKRFYSAPKKSRLGLILTVIVGVILIGGLGAFALYIQFGLTNEIESPVVTNTNQQEVVNANVNQEPIFEPPVEEPEPIEEPEPEPEPVVQVPRPLALAVDIDNDALTLAEENLYGVDPTNPDSDGDKYLDGAELLSGYDPTRPSASLSASGLFSSYQHPAYTVIYPTKWVLQDQETDRSKVQFLSGGQEYLEILQINNSDNKTLAQWYQQEFPSIPLDQTSNVVLGNLSGIIHPDNQRYYLINPQSPNRIFAIIYNSGDVRSLNFMTTFNVMVKSFKLR